MHSREFVSQSLTQLVQGVKETQEQTSGQGAKIGADFYGSKECTAHGFALLNGGGVAQVVHFDVAFTVTSDPGTKGGIGIVAGFIGLGSSGESKAENTAVSRVRFAVPIGLPKA